MARITWSVRFVIWQVETNKHQPGPFSLPSGSLFFWLLRGRLLSIKGCMARQSSRHLCSTCTKGTPSIMDASSIYQTLRYFCRGQCIPIQCNAGDPNQKKTLLCRFLELLDATAHCCAQLFKSASSSDISLSLTSLMTQDAFYLRPVFLHASPSHPHENPCHIIVDL